MELTGPARSSVTGDASMRFVRVPALVDVALHALVALAEAPSGERIKLSAICGPEGLSRKFVSKALNELRILGLIHSQRGSRGGYWLAVPPSEISVATVFEALDERHLSPIASYEETIDVWLHAEAEVRAWLDSCTVADLVARRSGRAPGQVPRGVRPAAV